MTKDQEITGGELTDLPNAKYEKFFAQFSEIDTLKIEQWKPVHIIAYFIQQYQKAYNTPYKFKFNSPSPSKSFEVFQIKKLSQMLSSKPQFLKDYIDWSFAEKVTKAKKKLTSISFLTNEEDVNYYKVNVFLSTKKLDRSSLLPIEYHNTILQLSGNNLSTYGDLLFINLAVKDNAMPAEFNIRWQETLIALQDLGFDLSLLTKLV
jgi:hypothetical protein